MDIVFKEILQKIKDKTAQGLANWQLSDSSNEYKICFVAGTVTIGTYYNNYGRHYNCKLLNSNGDILFSETQNKDEVNLDFSLLEFYSVVVDAYTNKKKVVNSILDQLKKDGEIGIPALPPLPADDLPF